MKICIVGFGSIGKRHCENFLEHGHTVAIVSRRDLNVDKVDKIYPRISKMLENFSADVVFICSETSKHLEDHKELLENNFKGKILIEKPLYTNLKNAPKKRLSNTYVSYNLRFSPLVKKLKEVLKDEKVLNASFYAGQYLPNWRPDRDYRETYSAKKELGGGVLLDLSHELDLAQYLFGPILKFASLSQKASHLEIDSDDQFGLLGKTKSLTNISIHLNYLDRIGQRFIIVNTDTKTIKLDLFKNTIQINENLINYDIDRNTSYLSLAEDISKDDWSNFTTFSDALNILKIIEFSRQENEDAFISLEEEK